MHLSRLLKALPGASVLGDVDIDVQDIAYDSRLVTPGTLFVAVPTVGAGPDSGGVRFIAEAVKRGAIAVVTSIGTVPTGVTAVRVKDTRSALADVSAEFFNHPSSDMKVYGVTGTDGKTTTTYWLVGILSAVGHSTGLIGTVETKIGQLRERNVDRTTTPESLDVQRLLRRMADGGVTHVALEASSHALVLDRLRGCRFEACALTNISGDHLEFHGSWQAYFDAKATLFTDLAPGAPAFLNRDDASYDRMAATIPSPIVSYGFTEDADIRASDVLFTRVGSHCRVTRDWEHAALQLPLAGTYNIANALAAIGLASTAGVSLEKAASALASAEPPPGRLQGIDMGQPFRVVVDYAHTPNAFRSALTALRHHGNGRLIAVFGAAGNRDRAKRPEFARIAAELTDSFIITNEDPFGERPEDIITEIAAGVPPERDSTLFACETDRARAIQLALEQATPGDTVVILGKGHEQSIMVNGQKQGWDDISVTQRLLEMLT